MGDFLRNANSTIHGLVDRLLYCKMAKSAATSFHSMSLRTGTRNHDGGTVLRGVFVAGTAIVLFLGAGPAVTGAALPPFSASSAVAAKDISV